MMQEENGEPIIIIRPSLKKISQGDSCRAALYNHLLYWIARKQQQGCDYWYATGEELYQQLEETWGITHVRNETRALIAAGLIGETSNPHYKADRTKHFYFHEEQARALIERCTACSQCPLCTGLPIPVLTMFYHHLTTLSNANDSPVKCLCQKHQLQLTEESHPFDGRVTALSKVSPKVSTKRDSDPSLSASRGRGPDASSLSLSEPDAIPIATDGYTPSPVADGLYETPTGEGRPLAAKGGQAGTAAPRPEHETSTPRATQTPTVLSGGLPSVGDQVFPASLPAHAGGGSSPSSSQTDETGEIKNPWRFVSIGDVSPEIAARRRTWQRFFNARRGNELLTENGPRKAEAIAIAYLVDHYTDAQLAAIDDFVTHKIFPYKQPERRGLVSGSVIRQQAQNARDRLKDAREWPLSDMTRHEWDHRVRALPQLTRVPREEVPEWFIAGLAVAAGGK